MNSHFFVCGKSFVRSGVALLLLILVTNAFAQTAAIDVELTDREGDLGDGFYVSWDYPLDAELPKSFGIFIKDAADGDFKLSKTVPYGSESVANFKHVYKEAAKQAEAEAKAKKESDEIIISKPKRHATLIHEYKDETPFQANQKYWVVIRTLDRYDDDIEVLTPNDLETLTLSEIKAIQLESGLMQVLNPKLTDRPGDLGSAFFVSWEYPVEENETILFSIYIKSPSDISYKLLDTMTHKDKYESEYPAVFGNSALNKRRHVYLITKDANNQAIQNNQEYAIRIRTWMKNEPELMELPVQQVEKNMPDTETGIETIPNEDETPERNQAATIEEEGVENESVEEVIEEVEAEEAIIEEEIPEEETAEETTDTTDGNDLASADTTSENIATLDLSAFLLTDAISIQPKTDPIPVSELKAEDRVSEKGGAFYVSWNYPIEPTSGILFSIYIKEYAHKDDETIPFTLAKTIAHDKHYATDFPAIFGTSDAVKERHAVRIEPEVSNKDTAIEDTRYLVKVRTFTTEEEELQTLPTASEEAEEKEADEKSKLAITSEKGVVYPPQELNVVDRPGDPGDAFFVSWGYPTDEDLSIMFAIYVKDSEEGAFKLARTMRHKGTYESYYPKIYGWGKETEKRHAIMITRFYGTKELEPDQTFWVSIRTMNDNEGTPNEIPSDTVADYVFSGEESVTTAISLFSFGHIWIFIFTVFFTTVLLTFINRARKGTKLFLRKIAGLDTVEEAVGRATEMGKPVLFTHGIGYISNLNTLAALSILRTIAEKVAEYRMVLKVTNYDPIVMLVSQETVKEAYSNMGVPDLYKDENVFFVAHDQFAYATGVDGLLLRDRPGAVFYMGGFAAESLLMTETGARIGAIQVAGTDSYAQLPFFITTCDYTLMGEELYAASAYLSREPKLLGSLKGQDYAKLVFLILITIGTILGFFGEFSIKHILAVPKY